MTSKTKEETIRDVLDDLPPIVDDREDNRQVAALSRSGAPATDSAIDIGRRTILAIENAALNPAVDVEKMKALLDMQERIMDRFSKMAFTRSFSEMSQELPRIVKKNAVQYKDKDTGKMADAFKFATYEDIDEKVRPILYKYGFSLEFTTDAREGGGLLVSGTLSHIEGHSKSLTLPLALDTSGGKNNIQAMGSTSSYGRRYATCILLNIITVGEDNDGSGAPPVPVDTETAAKIDIALRNKCKDMAPEDAQHTREGFLSFMGIKDVREILTTDLDKARNAIAAIGKNHNNKGVN